MAQPFGTEKDCFELWQDCFASENKAISSSGAETAFFKSGMIASGSRNIDISFAASKMSVLAVNDRFDFWSFRLRIWSGPLGTKNRNPKKQ